MQLLVSVSDAEEALEALAGGADVIDTKDPRKGALGAVDLPAFCNIRNAIGAARPLTAALGDAWAVDDVERHAAAFAVAGASLVKVGFGGVGDRGRAASLLAAAMRGALSASVPAAGATSGGGPVCGVVAVAYADPDQARNLSIDTVLSLAVQAQCRGLLIDTFDKAGPGLCALMPVPTLAHYAAAARRAGLLVMLAGRLSADDLDAVRTAGADVAGIRGAACEGGRDGRIRAGMVHALRTRCAPMANSY